MRFSKEMDQALRSLAYLKRENRSLSAREIAREQAIPYDRAGKILQKLASGRLIEGRRGRDGGYRLASPLGEINLLELQKILGEAPKLAPCLGQEDRPGEEEDELTCALLEQCGIRAGLGRFQEDLNRLLANYSVADITGEV
ncbi:MAG: Rrf2 family transcriptional regulator [Spirochaetales bacterium]|nr:Rrf2 family transcriptional regulator [Spirochaetales bacterium]